MGSTSKSHRLHDRYTSAENIRRLLLPDRRRITIAAAHGGAGAGAYRRVQTPRQDGANFCGNVHVASILQGSGGGDRKSGRRYARGSTALPALLRNDDGIGIQHSAWAGRQAALVSENETALGPAVAGPGDIHRLFRAIDSTRAR